MNPPILEMRGIVKSFPGVQALSNVDFALHTGEVHAIMGQNGAGKSTLIKIMTGVYPPDTGVMLLEGRHYAPRSPHQAQKDGVAAIHQEVNLLPYLSVAENIFIGRQPRRLGRIDWREINRRAGAVMHRLGIDIDVTLPLGSYPVAIRQMTAIGRALEMSGRVLVMDEPTSSLDETEVRELFSVIRRLRSEGIGIVFITHFIDQVFEIADRITVLRNGSRVGVFETGLLSKIELVSHMLGREESEVETLLGERASFSRQQEGGVLLRAIAIGRKGSIAPFDLDVRKGEVLGLAGLLGSGRTEVARLLFGADRPTSGRIEINGETVRRHCPGSSVRRGVGFSPEDRRTEGIVPDLSVRENIVLAILRRISRFGFISRRRQSEITEEYVRALGIVAASPDEPLKNLSGGNQQKVILARWLACEPVLLILDEPTRGIDVGAKAEIEALIESLASRGVAVVFISSELEEVVRRSHRVAVLRDREKVAEVAGEDISEQRIVDLIAGGKDAKV